MFEDGGTKEDFSLSQLSVPNTASALWSPGYNEDRQVCEADDLRIRETDISCELILIFLQHICLNIHVLIGIYDDTVGF